MNFELLEKEINQVKEETMAKVGAEDARYIRRIEKVVRYSGAAGRVCLMLSWFPPFWIIGTVLLSISKIMENMELGHNVIHGQYNFMNDERFNGSTYEWDIAGTSDNWRKTHNYSHHTYTNVKGMDHDIGYSILRIFKEQKWNPVYLFQPIYAVIFAVLFQWGVALQNLRLGRLFIKKVPLKEFINEDKQAYTKMGKQLFKDYIFFPIIAGPMFIPVILGNFTANIVRSLWTYLIIFCGHFTKDVHIFDRSVIKNESKGHWYYRQIMGSSNIKGGKVFHILSGNLSHQIEHHLFPTMPSYRYGEVAPKIKEICKRHGIQYNNGNIFKQFGQVVGRIVRYSLP
ncbi:acyl-CoA desaturase [Psychrosphaera haliotis]|uniref:fatty acid desaturase family protein n=1 Tax=Psychrosphaera haliotis TaxID=555083 RepID=UPI0023702DAB|nr:acyl-CoA desaturase [Psychrosphaera haliotis]